MTGLTVSAFATLSSLLGENQERPWPLWAKDLAVLDPIQTQHLAVAWHGSEAVTQLWAQASSDLVTPAQLRMQGLEEIAKAAAPSAAKQVVRKVFSFMVSRPPDLGEHLSFHLARKAEWDKQVASKIENGERAQRLHKAVVATLPTCLQMVADLQEKAEERLVEIEHQLSSAAPEECLRLEERRLEVVRAAKALKQLELRFSEQRATALEYEGLFVRTNNEERLALQGLSLNYQSQLDQVATLVRMTSAQRGNEQARQASLPRPVAGNLQIAKATRKIVMQPAQIRSIKWLQETNPATVLDRVTFFSKLMDHIAIINPEHRILPLGISPLGGEDKNWFEYVLRSLVGKTNDSVSKRDKARILEVISDLPACDAASLMRDVPGESLAKLLNAALLSSDEYAQRVAAVLLDKEMPEAAAQCVFGLALSRPRHIEPQPWRALVMKALAMPEVLSAEGPCLSSLHSSSDQALDLIAEKGFPPALRVKWLKALAPYGFSPEGEAKYAKACASMMLADPQFEPDATTGEPSSACLQWAFEQHPHNALTRLEVVTGFLRSVTFSGSGGPVQGLAQSADLLRGPLDAEGKAIGELLDRGAYRHIAYLSSQPGQWVNYRDAEAATNPILQFLQRRPNHWQQEDALNALSNLCSALPEMVRSGGPALLEAALLHSYQAAMVLAKRHASMELSSGHLFELLPSSESVTKECVELAVAQNPVPLSMLLAHRGLTQTRALQLIAELGRGPKDASWERKLGSDQVLAALDRVDMEIDPNALRAAVVLCRPQSRAPLIAFAAQKGWDVEKLVAALDPQALLNANSSPKGSENSEKIYNKLSNKNVPYDQWFDAVKHRSLIEKQMEVLYQKQEIEKEMLMIKQQASKGEDRVEDVEGEDDFAHERAKKQKTPSRSHFGK